MKWDNVTQTVFDCIIVGLRGLKNSGWLTLDEHEEIRLLLQKKIDEKSE